MKKQTNKSFNYYLLNKRLHPPIVSGFKASIILFIVNKNKGINQDKFILVCEGNKFWDLPKSGVKSKELIDDLFTTIAKNMEEELGFRGVKIYENKPVFKQLALIFDIAKQKYDKARSVSEENLGKPKKGKLYELSIMEYFGNDKLPLEKTPKEKIFDYRWVNFNEGIELMKSNIKLFKNGSVSSLESVKFNIDLFDRVKEIYEIVSRIHQEKQTSLF